MDLEGSGGVNAVDTMMTTRAIAKMFSVQTYTVVDWINEGLIPGNKFNGRWYVPRAAVLELAEKRHGEREVQS